MLLAAGSTDAHARVFSSFVKGVDDRPQPGVWGERLPFNTVCGEYLNNSAGWVHAISFSPSGDALAFAAHDSSITVVYPNGADQPPKAVVSVSTQLLPFMSLIWNGESEIIAAGYDCEAYRFQGSEGGWQLTGSLESKGRPGLGDAREEPAFNMFKRMDLKGKTKDDTKLTTVHQNTISTVCKVGFLLLKCEVEHCRKHTSFPGGAIAILVHGTPASPLLIQPWYLVLWLTIPSCVFMKEMRAECGSSAVSAMSYL